MQILNLKSKLMINNALHKGSNCIGKGRQLGIHYSNHAIREINMTFLELQSMIAYQSTMT